MKRARRLGGTTAAAAPMRSEGFTLLELLVVMAVLSLLTVIATPMLSLRSPDRDIRVGARQLSAGLREARGRAIALNRDELFTIDVGRGAFQAGNAGRVERLPPGVNVRMTTAASEQIDTTRGSIRFFPDGSSTGGRLALHENGRSAYVEVDWLTGRVASRSE